MKLIAVFLLLLATVHCSGAKPHSVTLKWNGDPNLHYIVYRQEEHQSSQRIVAQPVPCCEFTDKQVQAGKTYFYRVTSVREEKESAPSQAVEAKVPN